MIETINIQDSIATDIVLDDMIIARDGCITVGWELYPEREYSLTQDDYDSLLRQTAMAFRGLLPWTMVHRQDIYSKSIYASPSDVAAGPLGTAFYRHFDGRSYLTHRQLVWFTYNPVNPGKATMLKSSITSPASGLAAGFQDVAKIMEKASYFVSRCSDFMNIVSSQMSVKPRRVTTLDIEGEQGRRGLHDDYVNWFAPDNIITDISREGKTYLVRDGRKMMSYCISHSDDFINTYVDNTVKVTALSDSQNSVLSSFLSPLGSELECEHMVNLFILVPPQDQALQELERSRKNKTAFSQNDRNRADAEGLKEFISMIHAESTMAVYSHLNIIAWGPESQEEDLRGRISTAMTMLGMNAKLNTKSMPHVFFSCMPGAESYIGEDSFMLSELEQTLCLTINETYGRDFPGGKLVLTDRHRHIPVRLDIQEAAYEAGLISNYNAIVVGPSGSGKSYLMNWYARSCYEDGQHVFIIDKGGSYKLHTRYVNEMSGGRDGVYYEWSKSQIFSFNPMSDYLEWMDVDNDSIEFISSIVRTLYNHNNGGWTEDRINTLAKTLQEFSVWAKALGRTPVFSDYYDYLGTVIAPAMHSEQGYKVGYGYITAETFNIDSLLTALEPFCTNGRYGSLLNNPNPPDLFASRWVVFELDGLDKQGETVERLCTMSILHAFETKMRGSRDYKTMIIEEAWKAIATEQTAGYLRGLWKTARKFQTSAIVVSQQVSDIISSEIVKDAIVGNSPIKIFLDQRDNAGVFEEMCQVMGIHGIAKAMLRGTGAALDRRYRYREVFVSLGGRHFAVYGVELSVLEGLLNESNFTKKAPLEKKMEELGSLVEACAVMQEEQVRKQKNKTA